MEWFEYFFDELYYETYRVFEDEERNEYEANFIVKAMGLPRGARVLDLGCGYGRHAVYLARYGYNVVCFDLSNYLLEKARERVKEFNVEEHVSIVQGDMRELNYNEEFDGIYMFFTTFGYFDDKENFNLLKRIYQALKNDGVLLLDLWNPVLVLHRAYLYNGSRRTWYEAGDYLILEEDEYDILNARVKVRRIFYKKHENRVVGERWFSVRFYTYWEIKRMLEEAGLHPTTVYGSYRGGKYETSSPRMIVLSRKIPAISVDRQEVQPPSPPAGY